VNGKEHAIKTLEEALHYEKQELVLCQQNIKSLRDQATGKEGYELQLISRIAGLEDAINKLKGLANLEAKNNIP